MSDDRIEHWLLWMDGVGGFLVCPKDRIALGQAGAEPPPDVPLLADVSRRHAVLRRDGEGYIAEAEKRIRVNGKETDRAVLRSGDRLTLGDSCQILFEIPLAGSTSARLSIVSGHRLACPVQDVLLLSESLIFGPKQAHVRVPSLREALMVFKSRTGLWVRHAGKMSLHGKPVADRADLPFDAPLLLEEHGIALERWIP
ncbi:MAG: FHA domain-containing protein [Gemmataceae bacterium]|nr:FHA domain-containing protein [Gemmataceae bacterium]